MSQRSRTRRARSGAFTLVELLATVLVLSVLSAIAVPLYVNSRKVSAARICRGNIATIAAAESAYSTRFGTYVGATGTGDTTTWAQAYTAGTGGAAPSGGLVGAPEGLVTTPVCPLGAKAYNIQNGASGLTISCQDATVHQTDANVASTANWIVTLKPGAVDSTNPF